MMASTTSKQGGEAVSRLAQTREVAGSNPAPSFPAPVSPKRRAPGRSGAIQFSRWRTAPANSLLFHDAKTLLPGCPQTSGRSRHEWQTCSPYRRFAWWRQGRLLQHAAGLAAFLSSVSFLFWLTLASGPP